LPYVKKSNWHLRFNHLVGYGAKYYSYLVSKAIAARIWADCFEKDPLSSNAGESYRKKLLQLGGEKKPDELIQDLIGEKLVMGPMVKSLISHI
jgi:intermediate peptidase